MRNLFRRRDYERFDGPGFVMERDGRVVRTASTLDADGHAQMRVLMGEGYARLKDEMKRQVDDLYAVLHRYRPESMLGALWFRNAPMGFQGDDGTEVKDETVLAHVEYVATLYARNRGGGTEFAIPPHVLEDVQMRIEGLFASTVWLWMAQDAAKNPDTAPDTARDLWFRSLLSSLVVRYPGHFNRMKQMLLDIEAAMSSDASNWLGWSIADAVAVGDAMIALVDERINEAFRRGREEAERQWSKAWPSGRGLVARAIKRVIPPHLRPRQKRLTYGLAMWVQFLMQDAPVFSVTELSDVSQVPQERVKALMDAACLPWGSCAEDFYAFPHPTPPILTHPCLALGDDRYLTPVPTSFSWAIRPLVEELLKGVDSRTGSRGWDAYERARAQCSEQRVVQIMRKAMPHAGVFGGLKYSWIDRDQPRQGELDCLVLADDHALLVEIKAGSMTPEARRGAPDALRERLGTLIGEAHEQALRARRFMASSDEVEFEVDDDRLRVRAAGINDFILVTVNLDALDPYTTNLNSVADFGVLGEEDLPWSVSLLDLEEIAEALEFPAQLLHFIHRRRRVNELGFVEAYDEIDWFGHYLSEGLFFEHLVPAATQSDGKFVWSITGYSKDLDAHFMHDDRCPGDPPPIPQQSMPDDMRALLQELENAQHRGYLHLSLALLDLDWQAREDFFRLANELMDRTRADGAGHDMTMVLDDGEGGITFMCDVDRARLQRNLSSYCQLKKYQCQCSRWFGIGRLVDSGNWVDEAIIIKAPWEFSAEMEVLAERALRSCNKALRQASGGGGDLACTG